MDRLTIQSIAENLDVGETQRSACPKCKRDDTFSVSKMDDFTTLYQCFHADCDFKGRVGPTLTNPDAQRLVKKPRVWEGKPEPLPEPVVQWIADQWRIADPPWYYTKDYGGRIAMPILSPSGLQRGWVLRNDGSSQPKALTYVDEGEDALSWYKTVPGAPTILVEDIPSAVRASTYVNSVALCGTGIGEDRALEIAEYATRPIVVALDQDATKLSFKWARKYSLLWGTVEVLPLRQDLKDMQETEICALLERYSQ